jgi:type IV pilus assembly protein PilO
MGRTFSPKDKLIAVGLGMLAVVALAVLFGIKPQFSQLASLRQEQQVEQDKLADAKLKLERLDAVRQEAAGIEAKRISLARRLPEDPELPSLIVELQRVASAADLELDMIQIGNLADDQGFAHLPLKLEAVGTFYSVADFLYRMEKMTREIVVQDFSLQPDGKQGYPKLSITINARAFTLSAEAPITPPAEEASSTKAAQ